MTTPQNNFTLNPDFANNADFLTDWDSISQNDFATPVYIEQYVNAKHLACPMPLLKLKMALKTTQVGNGVYVTATDPNSTQDIGVFCRHLGYDFISFTSENAGDVFHLLVQKTV